MTGVVLSSGEITPKIPPKWSRCEWVNRTPVTGRSPRCERYSARAAAAVSAETSGSTTITPRSPSISDMLDRS